MTFYDIMHESWLSISGNKMRSFLTVLGIVIGIMAVVIMVAVGETVQQSITDQFSSLGTNTIMIRAGAAQSGGVRSGNRMTLTMDDVKYILQLPEKACKIYAMDQRLFHFSLAYESRSRREHIMTKPELVKAVAEAAGLSGKDAEKAVNSMVDSITQELAAGGKVQLIGFGTFEVTERSARQGRNPQTGETVQIAASKAPKFKAGKALKDAVNAPKKGGKKKK